MSLQLVSRKALLTACQVPYRLAERAKETESGLIQTSDSEFRSDL